MQKIHKYFKTLLIGLVTVMCLTSVIGFAACEIGGESGSLTGSQTDSETNYSIRLSYIAIDTSDAKILYKIGDEFTADGLVVTAFYSNDASKVVSDYEIDSSKFNGTEEGVYYITIKYSEGGIATTTNYNVIVQREMGDEIRLSSIELDTSNVKKIYEIEETFSYDGLVVTANYSDGTSGIVIGYTVDSSAYDSSTAGTYSIVVTYTDGMSILSGVYNVIVKTHKEDTVILTSISLDITNVKTVYEIGDDFTAEGLVVTANYSDGTSKAVTGYTIDSSAYDSNFGGTYCIYVEYDEEEINIIAKYYISVEYRYDLIYEINGDGTYGVIGITGAYKDVIIPSEHEGIEITTINEYAFENNTSLESIVIPGSVTTIGDYAFRGCSSLASVKICEGVMTIGECAFGDCKSLTSVTIGEGVEIIDYQAFCGCTSLTSVTIPGSVTMIGTEAFKDCVTLASVVIGEGVTEIGTEAFRECISLTNVTIPGSVMTIERHAFYYCKSLTSVTICEGVMTTIGDGAFEDCTSLTSVVMGEGVIAIEGDAFFNCTALTVAIIPKSLTRIEDDAFCGCTSLTSIYYFGTAEDWKNIAVRESSYISSATIYYYSESEPTDDGNYWHYVNGEIVVWIKEN